MLVKIWLTTWSETWAPPPEWTPLCLQIASISSKTMTWRGLESPIFYWSCRAGTNSFRMFSSDSPWNFEKISGPLTISRFLAFNAYANFLAIKVFPVPGGPYSKIPLTCLIPNFWTTEGGNLLEAKALLKMLKSSSSNPPIPISSILKSGLKMFLTLLLPEARKTPMLSSAINSIWVSSVSFPV